MAKLFVSQSRVKLWRKCKRAHYYRYVEKLEKKVKSRPLKFGGIVHDMLEASANKEDPFEVLDEVAKKQGKMFRAEIEEYGNIVEDIRAIMKAYYEYWKDNPLRYLRLNGKRSEHELTVKIRDNLYFVFKLDALVKSKNALRWLLEHKTGKTIPDTDNRWKDLQTCVYIKGMELLEMKPVNGVCWDFIRSKSPTKPQILQRGGLSIKNIDTLPSVVRDFGEENDEEVPKILLERAEANIPRFFQREFTPINREVIEFLWDDFLFSAYEIQEDKESKHLQKGMTIDKHCGWCDFELICRTRLTGGDTDYVKEREYAKKKKRPKKEKAKSGRGRNKKSSSKAGKRSV